MKTRLNFSRRHQVGEAITNPPPVCHFDSSFEFFGCDSHLDPRKRTDINGTPFTWVAKGDLQNPPEIAILQKYQ